MRKSIKIMNWVWSANVSTHAEMLKLRNADAVIFSRAFFLLFYPLLMKKPLIILLETFFQFIGFSFELFE